MPSLPTIATPKKQGVAFPVLRLPKLELLFADGSRAWLYQVGVDWLIRSVDHQGESLQVDLRDLVPDIESEVYGAAEHDRAGVIFFMLRARFKTSCAFMQSVQALRAPLQQRQAA